MTHSTRTIRRLKAAPQLAALGLSLAVGFQASLCPPGMDMGMEMSAGMDMAGPAADLPMPGAARAQRHAAGLHCVFGSSMDGDGRPTCPFAVGGIGPCGTTPPIPGVMTTPPTLAVLHKVQGERGSLRHVDPFRQVHHPPPRA